MMVHATPSERFDRAEGSSPLRSDRAYYDRQGNRRSESIYKGSRHLKSHRNPPAMASRSGRAKLTGARLKSSQHNPATPMATKTHRWPSLIPLR